MKNLIKIFTLSIVAAFATFSCQKVIDLDAERLDPEYAVEGSIDVGSPPVVILTKSSFLYDEFNVQSIEESFVNNAVITVSNGTDEVVLQEYCEYLFDAVELFEDSKEAIADSLNRSVSDLEAFFYSFSADQQDSLIVEFLPIPLPCFYTIPPGSFFLGEEGKTYSLRIVKDEDVITSSTKIPESFAPDSLTFKYNDNNPQFAQVFVNLTFPANTTFGKYVKFGSRKQGEGWFYDFLGGSVYSDATFDGATNLTLPLEARQVDEGRPLGTDRLFEKGDTAFLLWRNIDKETYDFLFTLENDGGATPFSSPTLIESNINGGLGLWGGFNTSVYKVYIP